MATDWYCQIDQTTYGPFPAQHIRRMAEAGKLKPTDFVKKLETGCWLPASSVKGLIFAVPGDSGTGSPPESDSTEGPVEKVFGKYRSHAIQAVNESWQMIKNIKLSGAKVPTESLLKLAALVRAVVPPDRLLSDGAISDANSEVLRTIANHAHRLAHVVAADAGLDKSRLSPIQARQHFLSRFIPLDNAVRNLPRLPQAHRGLGIHVTSDISASSRASFRAKAKKAGNTDSILGSHTDLLFDADSLWAHIQTKLSSVPECIHFDPASSPNGLPPRRLLIQVKKWEISGMFGTPDSHAWEGVVTYIDDDRSVSRSLPVSSQYVKLENPSIAQVYQQTAGAIEATLHATGAEVWIGWRLHDVAEISCPCCEHPHALGIDAYESLTRTTISACLRCGNDAISGLPEQVAAKRNRLQRRLQTSVVVTTVGAFSAAIFLAMYYLYAGTSHNDDAASTVVFSIAVVGLLAFIGGLMGMALTLYGKRRQSAAETQHLSKLKFPHLITQNGTALTAVSGSSGLKKEKIDTSDAPFALSDKTTAHPDSRTTASGSKRLRCMACDYVMLASASEEASNRCQQCGDSRVQFIDEKVKVITVGKTESGDVQVELTLGSDLPVSEKDAPLLQCFNCGKQQDLPRPKPPGDRGQPCRSCSSTVTLVIPFAKSEQYRESQRIGQEGERLYGKDEFANALVKFQQALALTPDDPVLLLDIGNVLGTIGWDEQDRRKLNESLKYLKRACDLYPDYERAQRNLDVTEAKLAELG